VGATDPVWALGAVGTASSAVIMFIRQVMLSHTIRAVEHERQTTVRRTVDSLMQQIPTGGMTVVVLVFGPDSPAGTADLSRERTS
jgi:hypothetical protein